MPPTGIDFTEPSSVLRRRWRRPRQCLYERMMDKIDLGERVIELPGEDRIRAVGRKIGVVDPAHCGVAM
jgi:hypothetical protein